MPLLAAFLLTIAAPDVRSAAAVEDQYLETIRVSDRIWVFKPKIDWVHGNGVAILGPDGVFFVDTFRQYNYAEEAIRRLRRITSSPVRYVFNTHSHNDHTFGNAVFRRVFPASRIIVQAGAVTGMDNRVKTEMADQPAAIRADITQTEGELKAGQTAGGSPLSGSMKAYWELTLREDREYQRQYRTERYVSPDITFRDSLTMRWGELTLQMIHVAEDGHSRSDAILWIPEQRVLLAGDLVVGPTPYYSLPGITKAVQRLIAMNPAIVIPGHGDVQHDLSYLQLLERAFTAYQHAADSAFAARVPRQAALATAFPDIDRAFTGDDEMRKFTYRAFFTNNVVARRYNPPPATPSSGGANSAGAPPSPRGDSLPAGPPTPADSEEALGAALAEQFDADRGVTPTPQSRRIEAYLQRIADSLGVHTGRRLPWRIHYDPHPAIKSGFALPGGHIVIWGGVLAYMSTEDEAAAIIAHEMEHTELGQVAHRLDSLTTAGSRSLRSPAQWNWREFGATYGPTLESRCDHEGAKLIVQAGYSPLGLERLLESYIALGRVHAPDAPPQQLIADRITQVELEIASEGWGGVTRTRPLRLP